MSLTSREVSRLAVFQYPPHMRSVISTSGMLRYRVRAPTLRALLLVVLSGVAANGFHQS